LGQLGKFILDICEIFAVQRREGHGPSGPMVSTPMVGYAHFSD